MPTCRHCGSSLPDEASFCPACGEPVPERQDRPETMEELFPAEDWSNEIPEDGRRKKILIPVLCVLLAAAILTAGLQLPSLVRKIRRILPGGQEASAAAVTQTVEPAPTPDFAGTAEPLEVPEEIPHLSLRPYLGMLSEEEADNFLALYRSVMSCAEECVLPHPVSLKEAGDLYALLYLECPEAIHLAMDDSQSATYSADGGSMTLHLHYTMDREAFRGYSQACRDLLERWKRETEGLSDREKEMYVYWQITESCRYDEAARNGSGAAGAMIDRRAKCDGIARAMQWAMQEMGIPCGCLLGTRKGETVAHCWNYIVLDGVPCEVDVTMDVRRDGERRISLYGCVNMPTERIRDAYVLNPLHARFAAPQTGSGTVRSYHEENGTYFPADADWREPVRKMCLEASDTASSFSVQFETAEQMEAFLAELPGLLSQWAGAGYIASPGWIFWREPVSCTVGVSFDPAFLG